MPQENPVSGPVSVTIKVVDFMLRGLGVVMAMLCGLNVYMQPGGILTSKMFWVSLLLALALQMAPSFLNTKTKLNLLLMMISLIMIELFLEIVGWCGLLPGVDTKYRYPWARVYWSTEGHGNGIRNRHGWYYPEFNLSNKNRIALIGDSFVEAVEVNRKDNMGVKLGNELNGPWKDYSVLSLGCHGTGPAHYFEVLQYAWRNFQVKEAVIILYLGNDVSDSSEVLKTHADNSYFYYHLDTSGELSIAPHHQSLRDSYTASIEAPHKSPLLFTPWILSSHCMSLQIPISISAKIAMRRKISSGTIRPEGSLAMDADISKLGLRAAPFAINPDSSVQEAMAILTGLLNKSVNFCEANSIKLRIVTVPFFSQNFYTSQQGAPWSSRVGDYDFLRPEREIKAWAASNHVSFLPLGEWMQKQKLEPSTIRSFYFTNGSGHFSEAGHQFIAKAMAENFYTP